LVLNIPCVVYFVKLLITVLEGVKWGEISVHDKIRIKDKKNDHRWKSNTFWMSCHQKSFMSRIHKMTSFTLLDRCRNFAG